MSDENVKPVQLDGWVRPDELTVDQREELLRRTVQSEDDRVARLNDNQRAAEKLIAKELKQAAESKLWELLGRMDIQDVLPLGDDEFVKMLRSHKVCPVSICIVPLSIWIV